MSGFMMRGVMALALAAGLSAQAPQPAPQAKPAPSGPKQPAPKSQGEVEALQAIGKATTVDEQIKAAENVLVKYADTEFKPMLLLMIANGYQQKGDTDKEIIYAERVLNEVDPKSYQAMLMVAEATAQRTREFDLDREEKLARVEKYANGAMDALKTAPKPRPDITDEQWEGFRKDLTAQAHQALGMAAMVRKKYDVAITEYKTAVDSAAHPDPATMVRLGNAYDMAGKYDDAIAILDKVMAMADAPASIKQFAQAEKVRATQGKSGGAKPQAPAATPPQVEIKKP